MTLTVVIRRLDAPALVDLGPVGVCRAWLGEVVGVFGAAGGRVRVVVIGNPTEVLTMAATTKPRLVRRQTLAEQAMEKVKGIATDRQLTPERYAEYLRQVEEACQQEREAVEAAT